MELLRSNGLIEINLLKCNCGCGEVPTTKSGWLHGHWMRSKERRENQSKRFKGITPAYVKKGMIAWNKGLTKDSDDRIVAKPRQDYVKEKISKTLTGRKRPSYIGRKVSKALTGIKRDVEFCEATSRGILESYKRRGLSSSEDMTRMIRVTRQSLRKCRVDIINNNLTTEIYYRLGYSSSDLKNHIEQNFVEGMSWENYGDWVIDHIRSICTFKIGTSMEVINCLSNLQPLWKEDNWKKNRR